MTATAVPTQTNWPIVFVIVGAGIVSAFQVGKATVALATIQADLALSLAVASWLLSAFAIVGALAGVPIGLGADRLGAKRIVIGGLALQGIASGIGALADGPALLLATRALEGLGFLAVTVGAPTLMVRFVADRHRERAFSIWATFMPVGVTAALLSVGLLTAFGWTDFWIMNAVLLCGYAVLVALSVTGGIATAGNRRPITTDIGATMTAAAPWLLGGLFGCFTAIFFVVFGFLPTILAERLAVSGTIASVLSAAAVIASAVGNLACGWLLGRGATPWRVLAVGFALLAIGGASIFAGNLPGLVAYGISVAFSFFCGFIPVVLIDAAPRHAPRPDLTGATMGFAMQGNNLGLVVGPAATGLVAGAFGWPWVALLIVGLAVIAALLVIAFRAQPGEHRAKFGKTQPA